MLRPLLAALAGFVAVGTAAAQTTVTFLDVGPERDAFNTEVVRLFEAENPDIRIDYDWIANEPYKTAIKVMLESNSPPDLYFVWAGIFANDFVDSGVAADIADTATRGEGWAATMPPALIEQFRYEGGLYGAPSEIYAKPMWKNDAFFAAHQLAVPQTIDEVIALCRTIRRIDDDMTPISFGGSESWTISHYVTMLFERHVPAEVREADFYLTADPDDLWTDPGYVAALRDLKRMERADCFNKGINSMDPGVSRTMFAIELAAMTFCGSWCPPIFDADDFAGRYSPFDFPGVAGGRGDQEAMLVGVQGYQLARASAVPEEAMRFLDFLLRPDIQAMMARMANQLPANASGIEEGDLPPVSVEILDMVAAAPSSVPPVNTVVDTGVGDVILKSGQDFLAGTVDAEGMMARVRAQAIKAKTRS